MSALTRGVGIGVGALVAGAAAAGGYALDRVRREHRAELDGVDLTRFVVPADDERVVVADDGVPLHVEVDNPDATEHTVLLSHGFTQNLQVWVKQRRALRDKGYRVVLWDQRGHGRSAEGEPSSYSVVTTANDLRAVLEATDGGGDLTLIGHSMGGMSMMLLGETNPDLVKERVGRAAFISTSTGELSQVVNWGLGRFGGVVNSVAPGALNGLAARQDWVDWTRQTGRDVERLIVNQLAFGGKTTPEVVALTSDMIARTRLTVVAGLMPSLLKHDAAVGLLAYGKIPALVMHGVGDKVIPVEHARLLAKALPQSELVIVEHAGHMLPLEQPQIVNEHLLALIDASVDA